MRTTRGLGQRDALWVLVGVNATPTRPFACLLATPARPSIGLLAWRTEVPGISLPFFLTYDAVHVIIELLIFGPPRFICNA